jgi:hypothetical protein
MQRRSLVVQVEQRVEFFQAAGIKPVYDDCKRIEGVR